MSMTGYADSQIVVKHDIFINNIPSLIQMYSPLEPEIRVSGINMKF